VLIVVFMPMILLIMFLVFMFVLAFIVVSHKEPPRKKYQVT
jgi:hypothetical protein